MNNKFQVTFEQELQDRILRTVERAPNGMMRIKTLAKKLATPTGWVRDSIERLRKRGVVTDDGIKIYVLYPPITDDGGN